MFTIPKMWTNMGKIIENIAEKLQMEKFNPVLIFITYGAVLAFGIVMIVFGSNDITFGLYTLLFIVGIITVSFYTSFLKIYTIYLIQRNNRMKKVGSPREIWTPGARFKVWYVSRLHHGTVDCQISLTTVDLTFWF